MWATIASAAFFLLRKYFEMREGKKISDQEFLAHIDHYQKQRAGTGDQAENFDNNMQALRDRLDREKEDES